MKRALGVTGKLILAEYSLLLLLMIGTHFCFIMLGIRNSSTSIYDASSYSLVITVFRVILPSYPVSAALFFMSGRVAAARQDKFVNTLGISLVSATIFCMILTFTPDWFFVRGFLIMGYSPFEEATIIFSVAAASIIAPILVHKLGDNVKDHIRRTLAFAVPLIFAEYILFLIISLALGFSYVLFGGDVSWRGATVDNQILEAMLFILLILNIQIVVMFGRIVIFNHHLVIMLLLIPGRKIDNHRFGLYRLLVANIVGCIMCIGLLYATKDPVMDILTLQVDEIWNLSLLHIIGATACTAPFLAISIRRRVERLDRILL